MDNFEFLFGHGLSFGMPSMGRGRLGSLCVGLTGRRADRLTWADSIGSGGGKSYSSTARAASQ